MAVSDSQQPTRICFIGSCSQFSYAAFKILTENHIIISDVFLSGHAPATPPKKSLPIATESLDSHTAHILSLAKRDNIPVSFLGFSTDRRLQWRKICAAHSTHPKPDFIFVACFPEKLPEPLINWPKHYSINLHPSLLPRYRGPDPIYWQLKNKESDTGFSLHIITDNLDAGPIIYQHNVLYPVGATRNELDTLLVERGALSFVQLVSEHKLNAREQDESQATYQAWPDENNRVITDKSI